MNQFQTWVHDRTIRKVAETLRVSENTIYKWCAGLRIPSTKHLYQISRVTRGELDPMTVIRCCVSKSVSKGWDNELR